MTPLNFHWFLPTNGGDGRQVVGGGHGARRPAPAGRPASVSYLGPGRPGRRGRRLRGALTPTGAWCEDAWLSTAMLSQVSERLKFLVAFRPGPALADPGRADGGHLPEPLRRPAAAQRRHRRREPRAADVRRLPGQGGPLRALRRVPARRPRAVGAARPSTFDGEHLQVEDAVAGPDPRPGAGDLLRRLLRRPPAGSPPSTPTSTSPGASRPQAVAREDRLDPQAGRGRGPRRSASASGCTSSPATPPSEAWAEADRLLAGIDPETIAARPGRAAHAASPRASGGCWSCTAASKDGPGDLPQPLGRRRPGARRRGHRAGRQPRGGRRPDRGVRRGRASTSSCSPATRTSRRPTGSARACCRSWPSAAAGSTPPRRVQHRTRCRSPSAAAQAGRQS